MARTGRPITSGDVRQAADGTWYFRYHNLPGLKPARPTVRGFATRAEAFAGRLAKMDELDRLREAGEDARAAAAMREWTLGRYVDYYLDTFEGAESTRTKQRHILKKAVAEFGATKLRDLTTSSLRKWRSGLASAKFETLRTLRQVLAQAVSDGAITRNPSDGIANPKPKPDEVEAFGSWVEVENFAIEFGPHYGPMIRFWAATGLRPAELCGLEYQDVDLDARRVHVRRARVDGEVVPPKTRGSARAVPLNAKAHEALAEVLGRDEETEGPIFRTVTGKPINLRRFRSRLWRPLAGMYGLSSGTYALRHTYATLALRSGQSTFEVARWMGTSIAMIDAHYGHLAADSVETAIRRFDEYVEADQERALELAA